MSRRVYIIILNWNGWKDTIECLESVLRLDYEDYRVIVCDNGSTDGSLERIKDWARGWATAKIDEDSPLRQLTSPPIPKPIPYVEYTREEAETGVDDGGESRLILIQTGANLGYAGGNNVGMRYALTRTDFGFVWLLNNDTVVEHDSLKRMVDRLDASPEAGMCGSTILYYQDPDKVQALAGATYNKWLALPHHIGFGLNRSEVPAREVVESELAYVMGASVLVKREFLTTVGLMDEGYFLYCEELDWATRGKRQFTLVYAANAIIYHKEGASAGSRAESTERSYISDFYGIRNRIRFTKKFFPFALPTVYLGIMVALLRRLAHGQWDRVAMIVRIMATGEKSLPDNAGPNAAESPKLP